MAKISNQSAPKSVKKPPATTCKGCSYGCEHYDFPTTEVEIDLTAKEWKEVEKLAKKGGFVSKAEYIRHALREAVKALPK